MIYILIVMWFGNGSGYAGKAALAVEFSTKKACLAAGDEIRRQQQNPEARIGTLLCAAKE